MAFFAPKGEVIRSLLKFTGMIACATSLSVLILAVVIYRQSYRNWHFFHLSFGTDRDGDTPQEILTIRALDFRWLRGELYTNWGESWAEPKMWNTSPTLAALTFTHKCGPLFPSDDLSRPDALNTWEGNWFNWRGFYGGSRPEEDSYDVVLVMPIGAIAAVAALLPGWWAWHFAAIVGRWLRGRSRRRAGKCIRCGYDLRGTPGRCPECVLPCPPT